MLAAKSKLKDAEKLRIAVVRGNLLDKNYKISKDNDYIYFPIIENKELIENLKRYKIKTLEIIKKDLEPLAQKKTLKELLGKKLTKKELSLIPVSFDSVGDIIILDLKKQLIKKKKGIANALLELNPNTKTVLRKVGIHKGTYRTQKMKVIGGEKRKERTHRENNALMKLDVEKVYFSSRLSNERARIISQVQPNESILVMFSGCGPYILTIAKNKEVKEIMGVEINPIAHKYAEENIELNKLKNATLYCGDVKKIVPKLKKKFSRILMPLPKDAESFLSTAFKVSKKGTMIHFYDFLREEEFPDKSHKKIDKAAKKAKIKYKLLDSVKCGQYSPGKFRVCIDFKII